MVDLAANNVLDTYYSDSYNMFKTDVPHPCLPTLQRVNSNDSKIDLTLSLICIKSYRVTLSYFLDPPSHKIMCQTLKLAQVLHRKFDPLFLVSDCLEETPLAVVNEFCLFFLFCVKMKKQC